MAEDQNQALTAKVGHWLYQNKDKNGTPEYATAVRAYKRLKSSGTQVPSWSEVPGMALENAPADAAEVATSLKDSFVAGIPKSIQEVAKKALEFSPLPLALKAGKVAVSEGKRLYETYGSEDKLKTALAEHPVASALDASVLAAPALKGVGAAARGATSATKGLRSLNKLKVDYPEAAGDVARDIKNLGDKGSYDLTDVSSSNQGAKGAVAKAHTDNKVLIDENYTILKDRLDPQKATSPEDFIRRTEAGKALASGDHQVMDHAIKSQIAAVEKLVGNTKQGAQLVHGLKKHVEISRLRDKVHGGISQFTDELNPLSAAGGRFGIKGLPMLATAANFAGTGIVGPAIQGATVLGGKLVDAATGRRSLPKLYSKQNVKNVAPVIDSTLPDVLMQKRATEALERFEASNAKAAREKEASNKKAQAEDKKQAVETRQAADNENTFRRDVEKTTARRAKEALAALEAKNKLKEVKAPKETFGISQLAVARVSQLMKKKAAEAAKLESSIAKATKAENSSKSATLKDSRNKPIRNKELYDAQVAVIQSHQANASKVASSSKSSTVTKTIELAVKQMQSVDGKGPKNQANRETFYAQALAKAKTKHERAVIKKALLPLVEVFRSGKLKK